MFAPTGEDGLVLIIEHGDGVLGEDSSAFNIIERTNVDKGVCKRLGGCGLLRWPWGDVGG